MIAAIRIQDYQPQAQRGNGSSRHRQEALAQRMSRLYGNIAHRQHSITNVALCFQNQPAMLPLQCSEAIARLLSLRSAAREFALVLDTLDPKDTQRLKPYGCIAKLANLEYQTSEAILTLEMFAPICQAICYDRVELHLFLRSLFPPLLATFEDCLSQLTALINAERQTPPALKGARV